MVFLLAGFLSRVNRTQLELFGHEFDDWPATIVQSMLDLA